MRNDPEVMAAMRLSALLRGGQKRPSLFLRLTAAVNNEPALHKVFKLALRQLAEPLELDELLPWLETAGLDLLCQEDRFAFALEEIAQRSIGQPCQPAIRQALRMIAQDINPETEQADPLPQFPAGVRDAAAYSLDVLGYVPPDLFTFVPIPDTHSADFWLGKYPVTVAQYARFLTAENFANKELWCDFPMFSAPDSAGWVEQTGNWGDAGWERLTSAMLDPDYAEIVHGGVFYPRSWVVPKLSLPRQQVPVVGISWFEANAYCKWLQVNWDSLEEGQQGLARPNLMRMPTEMEWLLAAGDRVDRWFEDEKQLHRCANIGLGRTTPVWMYPQGASDPTHLMDMIGNVREWQANFPSVWGKSLGAKVGTWTGRLEEQAVFYDEEEAADLFDGTYETGFRVALFGSVIKS